MLNFVKGLFCLYSTEKGGEAGEGGWGKESGGDSQSTWYTWAMLLITVCNEYTPIKTTMTGTFSRLGTTFPK